MSGPLKNTKHEAFTVAVFKGASGRQAYKDHVSATVVDSAADACASRLLNSEKVQARLNEFKERAVAKAEISKASLIKGVHEVTLDAQAKGIHSAALRGYELLGREFKTFTERKDVTVRSIGDLAEEEIKNALSELDAADESETESGLAGGTGKKGAPKKRRG